MAKSTVPKNYKVIAANRRARFDYAIDRDVECGIVLRGAEVKSLRSGRANIAEGYASVEGGELWLVNCHIAAYEMSGAFKPDERRKRKLLVHRREIAKLWSATRRQGMTLVPLVMYFNHAGKVKIKIGVARGKQLSDKRQTERERDWNRQKSRLLRGRG